LVQVSSLFDPLFGMDAVAATTGDRAWLSALCEAETALARACARSGLVELPVAVEIAAACERVAGGDPADLGHRAVAGGNPVIPLVAELREQVAGRAGADAAAAVHLGATSQDILDTASMLITRRALAAVLGDLAACGDACADLARTYRDTPMAGRTLLQLAAPTTFGALAATWGSALDRAHARLGQLRAALPVQLGGAVGTLSVLHPRGLDVLAAFAAELDLAEPVAPWHADRTTITELAGALGTSASAVAKVAGDVVLLAQREIGELQEAQPGGSSAMAHKQNPIAAVTARAAAAQAPGLVATLLAAAAPELQRGAGPWHAEWPALIGLLRATGGAALRLRASLTGLRVDTAAMAANLAALAGGGTGHAGEFVDRYLAARDSGGRCT
jgi:3-carboxy-cis,cis-muconate cycloisomerase